MWGLIYSDGEFITFHVLLILNFDLYRHIQENAVADVYHREIKWKVFYYVKTNFFQ